MNSITKKQEKELQSYDKVLTKLSQNKSNLRYAKHGYFAKKVENSLKVEFKVFKTRVNNK